ncbi:hypothetical protein PFISCL1PPCAC_15692, partial [Pristionchus fissidentatus]
PLRVVWKCCKKTKSSKAFDSLITNLSNTHLPHKLTRTTTQLKKNIENDSASERLQSIIGLPSDATEQQINAISAYSFADLSSSSFNPDELVSAIDKLCKRSMMNTQAYRVLMSSLSDISPASLCNASLCALVEIVDTNEKLRVIDSEEWRRNAKEVVADIIKLCTTYSDLFYALGRSNIWKNECIDAIKRNFKNFDLQSKISLLDILSKRKDEVDALFIDTVIQSIATDSSRFNFRQCVNLASISIRLKPNNILLKKKLIEEMRVALGSLEKWNDARTIVALFAIWKIGDDDLWKEICAWSERRARTAQFKDLAAIVNYMGYVGRREGTETAVTLNERMNMEKGGEAIVWLKSIVSLCFYSTVDNRLIESVLNTVFIDDLLKKAMNDERKNTKSNTALVHRLLMQVDYYASSVESYSGPRLQEEFINDKEMSSMVSSAYSGHEEEVDVFRACLSRVIVDPSHCTPQVHPSGIVVEARVPNKDGREEVVVYVPRSRYVETEKGERLLGSNLLSIKTMQKKGLSVHVFTYREMPFDKSQIEATVYIKKKLGRN